MTLRQFFCKIDRFATHSGEQYRYVHEDHSSSRAANHRLARQSHGRGRCLRRERRDGAARRFRPEPRPASTRRSSCATPTSRNISARACSKPSATSTAKSRRPSVGLDAGDQRALDKRMIELDGTPTKSRLGCQCDSCGVHGGGAGRGGSAEPAAVQISGAVFHGQLRQICCPCR